jgi:alpha-1,2-mannosyltransferase
VLTWVRRRTARDLAVSAVLGIAIVLTCWFLLTGGYCLDLHVYMAGGQGVVHGHDLYGPDVQVRGYGFTYPPFAALLFALPSLLPFGLVLPVMTIASLVALGIVIHYTDTTLVRRVFRDHALSALVIVVVMIVCEPVRATIRNGQINLLLGAMIMYDLLSPRPRKWRGALVGIAAAVKLTPALFVVYLIVRKRYREAVNASIAFALVTGLSWLILPGDSTRYWTKKLFDGSGIGDISRPSNQSLLGVAERLFGESAAHPVWAVLIVPTAVLGLGLASRVSDSGRESFALAITGVTACLISPVSWSNHWIWFIPLFAGMVGVARESGRPAWVWTIAVTTLFVGLNVPPQHDVERWTPVRVVVANGFVLVAVLTFAFVVLRRVRHGPADPQPGTVDPPINDLSRIRR